MLYKKVMQVTGFTITGKVSVMTGMAYGLYIMLRSVKIMYVMTGYE
jgi:hypothetical protein